MKTPKIVKTVVGSGEWRLSYDEDGEIVAIELWDRSAGIPAASYEALRIMH